MFRWFSGWRPSRRGATSASTRFNLIMSRELLVTGGHYLNTRGWAGRLFNIYVGWLKERDLT